MFGARGVAYGCAFVWCERCAAYHTSPTRTRGARYRAPEARLRWHGATGAPTPFMDPDKGTRVRGAIARDVPAPSWRRFYKDVRAMREDANASRDRHGRTPSAWPSIAAPARDPARDVTDAARDAFARLARMSDAATRERNARERDAARAAQDARLARYARR